ncbi:MAG: hypothetical protein JXR81_01955 [Candidatus Goldbacteria bacterium]|nr:hypothetical protein [Candidatus Goldiibacteriota bacterium]
MNLLYFFSVFILLIILFCIRQLGTGFKKRFLINDYVLTVITAGIFALYFTGQSAYAAAVYSFIFCAGVIFIAGKNGENESNVFIALLAVSAQAGAAYYGGAGVMAAFIILPAGIISTVCFALLAQNADKNLNSEITKILMYLWPVFSVSIPAAGEAVLTVVISAVFYFVLFHYIKLKSGYSQRIGAILFFIFSLQALLIMVLKGVANF